MKKHNLITILGGFGIFFFVPSFLMVLVEGGVFHPILFVGLILSLCGFYYKPNFVIETNGLGESRVLQLHECGFNKDSRVCSFATREEAESAKAELEKQHDAFHAEMERREYR